MSSLSAPAESGAGSTPLTAVALLLVKDRSRQFSLRTDSHDVVCYQESIVRCLCRSPRSHFGEVFVSPLRTVVQHRRIDVAAPDDVPDGTLVEVRVISSPEAVGLTESQWDDSLSGTADWLKWLDSLQPLLLTEDENWEAVGPPGL